MYFPKITIFVIFACLLHLGHCDSSTETHTLQVHTYPPVPIATVELNETVIFKCELDERHGKPKSIQWYFEDHDHEIPLYSEHDNTRLTVKVDSIHQAGIYACQIESLEGILPRKYFTIIVNHAPIITIPKSRIHTSIGRRAEPVCIIKAEPAANWEWLRNNEKITYNGRITTISRGENKYLVIRGVFKTDLANYTCRANNAIGVASATIEVTGTPPPPEFIITDQTRLEDKQTLIWRTDTYSSIIQYKLILFGPENFNVHELIIPSGDTTTYGPIHEDAFTLTGLNKCSMYRAKIQARNDYGWGPFSDEHFFATSCSTDEKLTNSSTEKSKTVVFGVSKKEKESKILEGEEEINEEITETDLQRADEMKMESETNGAIDFPKMLSNSLFIGGWFLMRFNMLDI